MDFIQEKTRTKRNADTLLADGKGRKSVKARVGATISRLSEKDLEQLDEDPQKTLKALADSDTKLADATHNLQTARSSSCTARAALIAEHTALVETTRSHAELQLKALNYILDLQRKEVRALKGNERHKKNRIVAKMVDGGYTKMLAKSINARLDTYAHPECLALDPSETRSCRPCGRCHPPPPPPRLLAVRARARTQAARQALNPHASRSATVPSSAPSATWTPKLPP